MEEGIHLPWLGHLISRQSVFMPPPKQFSAVMLESYFYFKLVYSRIGYYEETCTELLSKDIIAMMASVHHWLVQCRLSNNESWQLTLL